MTTQSPPPNREKRIDFDEIRTEDSQIDFYTSIYWLKNGKVIKQMKLDVDMSEFPICKSCLMFYGVKRYRDTKKVITIKGERYTRLFCTHCKSDEVVNCNCGEIRHRVSCPVGFNNYFPLYL